MPAYGIPGVAVSPNGARRFGIAAVVVAVLGYSLWLVFPQGESDTMSVTLFTPLVGEGVASGTEVRMAGVKVGSIESLEPAGERRQQMSLELDKSQVEGLTDKLSVDYVPGNLFGITELNLLAGQGGTEIVDGSVIDLTGLDAHRVQDATMSSLLRSIGALGNDVITSDFTEMLHQISLNTTAFAPLMDALVVTLTAVADTQQYSSSFLVGQFASALAGAGPMVTGGLDLVDALVTNKYMSSDANRAEFDANMNMLKDELVPAAAETARTAKPYFHAYIPMLTPLLNIVTSSVSTPRKSADELRQLLDRLDRTFHDSPSGPVLHANVDFRIVPAVSTPLFGAALPAELGGGR